MKYDRVISGTFIDRPNRFIANVRIQGEGNEPDSYPVVRCHVKNTGRYKEILVEGCKVVLQRSDSIGRKTAYDVIAAYKGDRLVNIDSQAPNTVVAEGLPRIGIVPGLGSIRREVKHGDSRIDILAEGERKCFVEVKGVTLEKDGVVLFPDAPTERGLKHLDNLIRCVDEGYDACVLLLIQMSDVNYFMPNYETHEAFGKRLKEASDRGVKVIAYDCSVTEDSIEIGNPVEVRFRE